MKKNDFKKLAIMGIASSALMAAHSAYATPAATSSQNSYLVGGSCGGHGGCKANPNHRTRDKTIQEDTTLAFFGFGETNSSDKDMKDKNKNPNKDLNKDTDKDQNSFDHDAGSVGSDKGSISKLAFFGKEDSSNSAQNRDTSSDQTATDELANDPNRKDKRDQSIAADRNSNNKNETNVALSDDSRNSDIDSDDIDSDGRQKNSRVSSYGDKASTMSSNQDNNFDQNDEDSDDDMALNDSTADENQNQAADAAANNTTAKSRDAATGNADNS